MYFLFVDFVLYPSPTNKRITLIRFFLFCGPNFLCLPMPMLTSLFTLIVFAFSGCLSPGQPCCELVGTSAIDHGLYVERYRTYCAGVFGEMTTCYLTDSVGFRQVIGRYDEHEHFRTTLRGDSIITFNCQTTLLEDTVERRSLSITQLRRCHQTDSALLQQSPLFGTNTIACNTDFYPASSYKAEEGYTISQVQFKCGNLYQNAVFCADSSWSIFLGVDVPGEMTGNYKVRRTSDSIWEFYNVTFKHRVDTTQSAGFSLAELKKEGMGKTCLQRRGV
jgi:hypothetical protein